MHYKIRKTKVKVESINQVKEGLFQLISGNKSITNKMQQAGIFLLNKVAIKYIK